MTCAKEIMERSHGSINLVRLPNFIEHSKSLGHEVNEMIKRADEDGDSFLV
jgi:hypothetical protein